MNTAQFNLVPSLEIAGKNSTVESIFEQKSHLDIMVIFFPIFTNVHDFYSNKQDLFLMQDEVCD